MIPNIVSIAGSDSSGGAGIQADIKSISAAGGYAMTAITALTAQNTQGVKAVHAPPASFLEAQLHAISEDITIHGIKVGMLANAGLIAVVAEFLKRTPGIPIVIDPVMISTSGARLLDEQAMEAMKQILPMATVITPNLPELAVITGQRTARTVEEGVQQARAFQQEMEAGPCPAVLVKGGHAETAEADNVVLGSDGHTHRAACPRIETKNTHGTGCSLSSALATRLGLGHTVDEAVDWATTWIHGTIATSEKLKVGTGHGPVHHFHHFSMQRGS